MKTTLMERSRYTGTAVLAGLEAILDEMDRQVEEKELLKRCLLPYAG
jgi:hypothetical protein